MRRLAAGIAAIATLSLLLAGPAPAASAKLPPPPKSLAAATIDAHLGYMPQSTCTPKAKPGATAVLRLLIATWGGSSSGISRGCGAGTTSEHKEGRALDWRMSVKSASQRKRVGQAVAWLTANNGEVAYRLGVMYIIWNQQIWSLYYPELGWRRMADRGSVTANHKNHVHISLSWDGAMKQTSWWTGIPVTQPLNSRCGVNGAHACLPTIGRGKAWPLLKTPVPPSFLPAPWTEPGLGGSPQVGRTLTAVPGTWVPADATLTYQWRAGSKDIPGAVAATYVVGAQTVGKEISVSVTATSPAGTTTRATDGTTAVLKARFTAAAKPAIAGTAATDQTLTADPGAWATAPDSLAFAWKRNGKTIAGATTATYLVTPRDTGKKLTVTVTARKAGYVTASMTSVATTVAKAEFTTLGVPTISGSPVVGGILTADAGTWSPAAGSVSYQWYAGTRQLGKATASTLTLATAQAGTEVRVRVRVTRPGYRTADAYSAKVAVTTG
ncbi:MAG TPA: hypothetical protein VGK18_15865 [Propionicimonas sp.]|uniref:hypothetical protein n=1 Tax=Propionicimonas sp. TaxID=1955623 RepID=UPI002F42B078